jgi:hypothetical protein
MPEEVVDMAAECAKRYKHNPATRAQWRAQGAWRRARQAAAKEGTADVATGNRQRRCPRGHRPAAA